MPVDTGDKRFLGKVLVDVIIRLIWGEKAFRSLTMGLGSSTFPQNMSNYFLNHTSLPGTTEAATAEQS